MKTLLIVLITAFISICSIQAQETVHLATIRSKAMTAALILIMTQRDRTTFSPAAASDDRFSPCQKHFLPL